MSSEQQIGGSEQGIEPFDHLYTRLVLGMKAAPGRVSDAVNARYDETYRSCSYVYAWKYDFVPDDPKWPLGTKSYRLFLSMDDEQERMGFVEKITVMRGGRVLHMKESTRKRTLIVADRVCNFEDTSTDKSALGKSVFHNIVNIVSDDPVSKDLRLKEIAREAISIFQSMPRKPLH